MKENLKRAAGVILLGLAAWYGIKPGPSGDWQWALNIISQF